VCAVVAGTMPQWGPRVSGSRKKMYWRALLMPKMHGRLEFAISLKNVF
jgi:hypothetical protein